MPRKSESTESARKRKGQLPPLVIFPDGLYFELDLRVAWACGENMAYDMEHATPKFKWVKAPAWETKKFALGKDIIQWMTDPEGYAREHPEE